jgi:ArsR family transcriptional regulator, arsenate/arsenite/antimonite-responsive transcriptional repressor
MIFRYLSKYLISYVNKVFRALNDPTRREILKLLKEKDMPAGEIADAFQISKPSISHHLDILSQAELVTSEKKGQFVIYSLSTTVLDDIMEWIITLKNEKL